MNQKLSSLKLSINTIPRKTNDAEEDIVKKARFADSRACSLAIKRCNISLSSSFIISQIQYYSISRSNKLISKQSIDMSMVDYKDDKLFHYLVSRVQSRENASMAVVTIMSSASLILLSILNLDRISETFPPEYFVLGILFPAVGIAYFELTYRGIHSNDHKKIRDMISKESPDSDKKLLDK